MDAFQREIFTTLGYAPETVEPGRFVRFPTSDRKADKAGWAVLFPDGRGGCFGDHRSGLHVNWRAQDRRSGPSRQHAATAWARSREDRQVERDGRFEKHRARWEWVWHSALPLASCDAASRYLAKRGLITGHMVAPSALRCARLDYWQDGASIGTYPVMLAAVRAPNDGIVALHRTYLTDEGSKADVPTVKKLTGAFGPILGGAIRLLPHEHRLGVAEGIETALAASHCSRVPTWAAVSASGLAAFQWPSTVQELFIFGDNDTSGTGQRAANRLAVRACHAGLTVRVLLPSTPGTDWADVLKSGGAA